MRPYCSGRTVPRELGQKRGKMGKMVKKQEKWGEMGKTGEKLGNKWGKYREKS